MISTGPLLSEESCCDFGSFAWLSDRGLVRTNNEDAVSVGVSPDGQTILAVIADGMGGYDGGELAASIAVSTFEELLLGPMPSEIAELYERTLECYYTADAKIRAYDSFPSMGATVVSAVITRNRLLFLHAGDARCYVIRNGMVFLRTGDHSIAALIQQDPDGRNYGQAGQFSGIVTSCLGGPGQYGNLTVDPGWDNGVCEAVAPLLPGDVVLLCSDGLWNNVPDTEIGSLTWAEPRKPASIASRLVNRSLAAGGHDNISVAVILLDKPQSEPERA